MTIIDVDPQGPNNLYEQEAKERASHISNVSYDFNLHLAERSAEYNAHITIRFDNSSTKGTFLEFIGKEIHKFLVNGEDLIQKNEAEGPFWKSNRLMIPGKYLKSSNVVVIHYTNLFDHTGSGFHQFVDPEDNQEYLFTDFEPYEAHRLLPCFDQPNIKAKLSVTVTAPSHWQVICNYPAIETSSTPVDSLKRKVTKYETTPSISTYLFAIIAGPYESFSDEATSGPKEVPLRILCRKSLVKYMQPDLDELFTVTKQGMKFYADFFGYPYPFAKYDQVWVPEYNQGAMENVGAVTFTESYIFRDPPTESRRCSRADTLLHELAHMWFGNLVSPTWWDGLWLNESFATFMAAYALASATRFGSIAWLEFNSSMKKWAEFEDQLVTTHPIQGSVPDTESTFLNFDGITYGKGASVLKQLVRVLGEEAFRAGMRYYFQQHQWGNTTITDFLKALEHGYNSTSKSSNIDLIEWSKYWLETSGINTLIPSYTISNQSIDKFVIQQQAQLTDTPTLRPHTLEIGLFYLENGKVTSRTVIAHIKPAEFNEISEVKGLPEPQFVFINFNDHAYAKVLLDRTSSNFVLKNMHLLDNPLLRQLLWGTLSHMVRDRKLKPQDFIHIALEQLPNEHDNKLIQSIIRSAEAVVFRYTPDSMREEQASKWFEFCNSMFQKSKPGDSQISWANATISAAGQKNINDLVKLFDNTGSLPPSFEFDQGMRWNIITRMMAFGIPNAEERLKKEEERDRSDRGIRYANGARAAIPTEENKSKIFELIRTDRTSSYHILRSYMGGFRWWHQRNLIKKYDDKFFDEMVVIFNESGRTKEYQGAFFQSMFPFNPEDEKVFERAEELLKKVDNDSKYTSLARWLREELDDLKRVRDCRKFALSN